MRVINFGSMNVDYVYSVNHFVRPGETIAAKSMNMFPGGKGLNQSIALSRAGAKVCHVCCYGNGGEMLLDFLIENGVDTTHLKKCRDSQGQAIIQIDSEGQNSIIIYAGSNAALDKNRINEIISQCTNNDIVLLQNEISNAAFIIDCAHEKGIKVVFNPSPIDDAVAAIDFSKIWWLIINEVEGREISGKLDYADILAELGSRYPNMNIVFTKGKDGASCVCGDKTMDYGVFDFSVVDTTAAGDTFTGYFLAGIAAGDTLEKAMLHASVASSICVSRAGAAPSIPTQTEVLKVTGKLSKSL